MPSSLTPPSETSWDEIKRNWPSAYVHRNTVAFVTDDGSKLTQEIADTAGISDAREGIVIQLDYYSGYTDSTLVEWLSKQS